MRHYKLQILKAVKLNIQDLTEEEISTGAASDLFGQVFEENRRRGKRVSNYWQQQTPSGPPNFSVRAALLAPREVAAKPPPGEETGGTERPTVPARTESSTLKAI